MSLLALLETKAIPSIANLVILGIILDCSKIFNSFLVKFLAITTILAFLLNNEFNTSDSDLEFIVILAS
ncbi:hypothetical protein D3C84_1313760 [compost metagenome]